MDLNKLLFFKVTAELQSVTRAARQLETSQPFLSRSIQALEAELGAPLFLRSGRGITLSPFGHTYYPYVKSMFDRLEDGAKAVQDLQEAGCRTLRIGTNACSFLPAFLGRLSTQSPPVSIRQQTNSLPKLLAALEDGVFDFVLAVSPRPLEPSGSLSACLLIEDEMRLLLPARHPLSRKNVLSFEDIQDQPLVAAPEGFGMTDCLLHQFHLAQVSPQVAIETTDLAIIPRYVANGLGISAFPAHILPTLSTEGLADRPLGEPSFRAYFYVLWNSSRYQSPLAELFIQRARAYYPQGVSLPPSDEG